MKKRYLIAGAYGLAGAALAAKRLRRPADVVWEEHAASVRHSALSRFAEVEGLRVHYQEAGDPSAPAVLLVHGFCASTFVWADVLLPIAEAGFRVIAADLPGYGFSAKPRAGEYTIEWQARHVVGLMDRLGIDAAALAGSSYGGAVAAVCALDYADRVERLVLIGAVTNDEARRQFLLRLAGSPVMGDLISPLLVESRRLMRWRMRRVYAGGNVHLFDEARLEAHHRPLCTAGAQRAMLRTLRRWRASRVTDEAGRIEQPTLLIWGEEDRETPLRHGERLHARLPHARLVVFRGCGHLPQEERPEEVAGLVAGFCRGTRAAGGAEEKLARAAV